MKWTPSGSSRNVEDRRAETGGRRGGLGGMRLGVGGFLVLAVGSVLFRTNLFALLEQSDVSGTGPVAPAPTSADEQKEVEFVSFVLDDVQASWKRVLPSYQDAHLVLFREAVESGCGAADAGMGPFYCPVDEKAYLDLSFFDELHTRFGAPGDFAQAYVLAHEIGHHVQHQLGIDTKQRAAVERNPKDASRLSVAMELQADCFAGIWGHSTEQRNLLDPGEVKEALGAAAAIGDDRLQKQAGRRVNPETFTHGSSQQRVDWFTRGWQSGEIGQCDTFAAG